LIECDIQKRGALISKRQDQNVADTVSEFEGGVIKLRQEVEMHLLSVLMYLTLFWKRNDLNFATAQAIKIVILPNYPKLFTWRAFFCRVAAR
jgi:hypothetical protein